jgi:glycosyltransferase involved in cell wall biosynthesis
MSTPIGVKPEAAMLVPPCSEKLMTVAVIIPTFNHARFLDEAISSVLAQTRPADEIIVVDDGSTDDPAAVVARFSEVHLIRQQNRGLSAARNTGLRSCATSHVVFLDADDRLLPIALEAGLNHAARRPDCALVYGGYCVFFDDGKPRNSNRSALARHQGGGGLAFAGGRITHLELLRSNLIAVPATVLYRRECVIEEGGFDETLHGCGDYDLYLRMARRHGIANYPVVVAEYRRHMENMSNNHLMMLREVLLVLHRHEKRILPNVSERVALRNGRAYYRAFYTSLMLKAASARPSADDARRVIIQAIKISPLTVFRWSVSMCKRRLWRGDG